MHHYVGAMLYRTDHAGSAERIVDDHRHSVGVGHVGYGTDIDRRRVGITQSLYKYRLGVRAYRPSDIFRIRRIDKRSRDAVSRESIAQQIIRSAVDIVGGNYVIADARDIDDLIGYGSRSRGYRQGRNPAL